MGIFNRGEMTQDIKKINALKNEISRSKKLSESAKKVLLGYLSDVLTGTRKNVFLDTDTMVEVLRDLARADYWDMEEALNNYIYTFQKMLPAGSETKDAEYIKSMILNSMVGNDSIISRGLFNQNFYNSFNNIEDYVFIMNVINSDSNMTENFSLIVDYALKISRYMLNDEQYRRNLLSTLSGLREVIDSKYQEYLDKCYDDTLKAMGIYSVDEREIARVNDSIEKIDAYIESFEFFKQELDRKKRELEGVIKSGKGQITTTYNNALLKLREEINIAKDEIIKKLDERMLELEAELKKRSDDTFVAVLEEYKKKMREFRVMFNGYSEATSKDLIRIQKAAEEAVGELEKAVSNNPQLEEFMKKANEDNKLRETLIGLIEKEEKVVGSLGGEMARGADRIIIPASPSIIIPETPDVSRVLIPAFDDSIPFSKRIEDILRKKELREKSGEIFHEKTEQIIRDIIEGDWPYLWGPSGCGKSHLMKQIADLIGIKLVKNGKITEPYTVMGFNDPQGRFRATQAYYALVYGYLLGLDEFDNGNQDTIVIINEIYSALLDAIEHPFESHYVTFAEDVPALVNPNFRMISAGNTSGDGENPLFSSRGKLDESVQERMSPIFVNYDNRVEEHIFGDFKEWYDFFVAFRLACEAYAKKARLSTAPGIGTTRDASAIRKYVDHNSKSLAQIIAERFVQTKSEQYRESIGRFIANKYDIEYDGLKAQEVTDELAKIKAKTIAREFVYQCKKGVK